jgi:hypothetical protein
MTEKDQKFIGSLSGKKKFTKRQAKTAKRIWESHTGDHTHNCFCSQSSRDTYVKEFLNWVNNLNE